MRKEYLEALNTIDKAFRYATTDDNGYSIEPYKVFDVCNNEFDTIKQALQRLEAIDSANPSEALEQYETIYDLALAYCEEHNPEIIRSVLETRNENIKQALIKAQEQEKVVKAFEVLKDLLLLEVREIGGKYYVKYYNREDGNYIDFEISEDLYEVLK